MPGSVPTGVGPRETSLSWREGGQQRGLCHWGRAAPKGDGGQKLSRMVGVLWGGGWEGRACEDRGPGGCWVWRSAHAAGLEPLTTSGVCSDAGAKLPVLLSRWLLP